MATANLLQTSVSGGVQNALSLQGDGVFFPKASTTSRLALTLGTTDKGFIVYDTTDNNIYFWNGTAWESVPSSGDAGANGAVQYNDAGIVSGATNFVYDKATGRVGVATATPADFIEVVGSGANGIRVSRSGVPTQFATLSAGATGPTLNASSALGSLTFGIAGTAATAMTLDSTGLGIGVAPQAKLHVNGEIKIADTYSILMGTASEQKIFAGGAANNTYLTFNQWTGAAYTERLRIGSTGDVTVGTGNVVMGTSGKGIDFSATASGSGTMTSELLNDYEEGTWDAAFATTGGTVTISAAENNCRYTKIGRVVTVNGYISVSSVSSPTGALTITNLPFQIAAGSEANAYSAAAVAANGLETTATGQIVGFGSANTTSISLLRYELGNQVNLASGVKANSVFIFSLTYSV